MIQIIQIVLESINSLIKGIDIFLQSKDLTLGAILALVAPFIVIWMKVSNEKGKKAKQLLIEQRQLRIESKIDDLMQDRGVVSTWSLQEIGSTNMVPTKLKLSQIISFKAIFKKKLSLRRKKKMSISRKLLMAIFGAVILVLNQQLGWSLDPDSIIGAGSLIISFILGQSIVDTNGIGQFAPLIEKLKSKKLWAAVVGSIIIVLNDTFKWGMDANSIYMLAGTGVSFILGKSAISVIKAAGGNDVKPSIDGSSDK